MTNQEPDINFIDSILEVKASGVDVGQDELNLPEGKSIAELLNDQEKKQTDQE